MQQSMKHAIFVDISKTQVSTFINKFYTKNMCTEDKKKESYEYLSAVFDARGRVGEVSNSLQKNLMLRSSAQSKGKQLIL